jgi:ribosome-binding protein aMBF1 (putative translation factor)
MARETTRWRRLLTRTHILRSSPTSRSTMPMRGTSEIRVGASATNVGTSATRAETLPEAFSRRVRDKRVELGWTQRELADKAGCSLGTVKQVEAAHRDFPLVVGAAIADALGVPMAYLTAAPGGKR